MVSREAAEAPREAVAQRAGNLGSLTAETKIKSLSPSASIHSKEIKVNWALC
jgi:hypothetical protein